MVYLLYMRDVNLSLLPLRLVGHSPKQPALKIERSCIMKKTFWRIAVVVCLIVSLALPVAAEMHYDYGYFGEDYYEVYGRCNTHYCTAEIVGVTATHAYDLTLKIYSDEYLDEVLLMDSFPGVTEDPCKAWSTNYTDYLIKYTITWYYIDGTQVSYRQLYPG